jgi:hypothetical protein
MREAMERRITELREEFEAGRRLQAELQARHDELGRTLLRISGAIQVLGETLAEADAQPAESPGEAAPPLRVVAAG